MFPRAKYGATIMVGDYGILPTCPVRPPWIGHLNKDFD